MQDCLSEAILAAQIPFWLGVLVVFFKILWRVRGNPGRAMKIMIGFGTERRDRIENMLGLAALLGTCALIFVFDAACRAA